MSKNTAVVSNNSDTWTLYPFVHKYILSTVDEYWMSMEKNWGNPQGFIWVDNIIEEDIHSTIAPCLPAKNYELSERYESNFSVIDIAGTAWSQPIKGLNKLSTNGKIICIGLSLLCHQIDGMNKHTGTDERVFAVTYGGQAKHAAERYA